MTALAPASKLGFAIMAAGIVAFFALVAAGAHQTVAVAPVVVAWCAALYGVRPMVRPEKYAALYFAFAILAFIIFFLHETYEFHGKVRYFPLIVGYTGLVLSILDVISLTPTRFADWLNLVFGSTLGEPEEEAPRPGRVVLAFLAMSAGVVLVWLFGFLIASPLFVFLWMWLWGRKPILQSVYGGVGTIVFIWLLFEWLLETDLYEGVVIMWLTDNWFS